MEKEKRFVVWRKVRRGKSVRKLVVSVRDMSIPCGKVTVLHLDFINTGTKNTQ
jgi:hypothetical protein